MDLIHWVYVFTSYQFSLIRVQKLSKGLSFCFSNWQLWQLWNGILLDSNP